MLAECDTGFLRDLAAVLPEGRVVEAAPRYLEEPRGRWHGRAGGVVLPRSVEEVAAVVRACAAARVGLVPYGGGTGLVGGQVAPEGPVPLLLSMEKMAAIRAVHPRGNVLIAEAGVVLADVQAAAAAEGRLFPLSLASEGSARIGGVLAANAGGVNVLRYGNARELCLGLEAVLPDGSVWCGLKRLRKDNTGYDLRNLLIGAEGTLGVITAASLRLFLPPARSGVAVMVVRDPGAALDLLGRAQARVGEGVSAFELISGMGLRFLAETMPQVRLPFADAPDWMVLVELGLSAAQDPGAALEALFAEGFEAGLVLDGVIAQSQAQGAEFWAVRESIPEANRLIGAISSHDISLPLEAVEAFLARAEPALARIGAFRINCFGHLGDGNLHYNVFPPAGVERAALTHLRADVQRCVHDLVDAMGGSVSAEHGIGRAKVADLQRYGDPAKLAAMRAIKRALDPAGIMNPGAVLPVEGG
ncbi:FAD-binding oxidoreductase [Rhodobacteraceae bacterium 2376]|uniref:FAD-binding oxidoreductase n=1 Tax=Rhabdonatronobacter sediminivivens TaxID=2743469 RepID=A0A7Z0HZV2_9RHOB|nr:FAD-binding oxidoreductase [Rhabdonatronobacter sediminivivens]NYS24944.1 FAD-binding oxidoreductase [Rhabdonatronobacter sediminivivens]